MSHRSTLWLGDDHDARKWWRIADVMSHEFSFERPPVEDDSEEGRRRAMMGFHQMKAGPITYTHLSVTAHAIHRSFLDALAARMRHARLRLRMFDGCIIRGEFHCTYLSENPFANFHAFDLKAVTSQPVNFTEASQ